MNTTVYAQVFLKLAYFNWVTNIYGALSSIKYKTKWRKKFHDYLMIYHAICSFNLSTTRQVKDAAMIAIYLPSILGLLLFTSPHLQHSYHFPETLNFIFFSLSNHTLNVLSKFWTFKSNFKGHTEHIYHEHSSWDDLLSPNEDRFGYEIKTNLTRCIL